MRCPNCTFSNPDDGHRYCEDCGAYLAVKPGAFHNDLLQLSRDKFVETVSDGLPLIYDNAAALWNEAQEIAALGNRRAVGILQLFAEEEAAKCLLLFDAVRCPRARKDEFRRLVKGFANHLAKGIYVKYYGSRLRDLREAKTIVDLERREVYREGEYGEFIAPNSVLYMREKRLYVSYVREDDNRHQWHQPYSPDLLFGDIVPSAIVRMMKALNGLGLFSKDGLQIVEQYWNCIDLEDPVAGEPPQTDPAKNIPWGQARDWNIETLMKWEAQRGRDFQGDDEVNVRIVVDELLFPLYPFDLSPSGDVADLPPPRWPEEY